MSIAKSSFLFSAGTFLSRILGLVRDQVVLGVFGATVFQDAFIIAFRIPNLLREIFAEGALGSSFTTIYTSLHESDAEQAQNLLLQALYMTFILSAIICGMGILFAPYLVNGMTLLRETDPHKIILVDQTTKLTRILFPYLGFTIMGSIVMGALHQQGRFFLSAVSPLLFNLGNILGALVLANVLDAHCPNWLRSIIAEPKITGLAFGVLLGGAAQFGWQLWGIWQKGVKGGKLNLYKFPWSSPIRSVFWLMIPAALAASTGPINLFVNTNFASSLSPGVVTWLNTAFRLLQLPIGIFAVAVGQSALPRLSRALTKSHKVVTNEVSHEFQMACELVLWLLFPCMIFLLINCVSVTSLLFEQGHFHHADTIGTSDAMYAYSFGIIGYGLIKVLTSFYYAVGRTTYAMVVAISSVFVNFFGNYFLVKSVGHMGLAYTSSLTLSANAVLLLIGLRKHHLAWDLRSIKKSVLLLGLASLLCIISQKYTIDLVSSLLPNWHLHPKLESGGIVMLNGINTVLIFGIISLNHIGKPLLQRISRWRNAANKNLIT